MSKKHVLTQLSSKDLLAHPNLKGFVTHAGYLSFEEALCHQIPMVIENLTTLILWHIQQKTFLIANFKKIRSPLRFATTNLLTLKRSKNWVSSVFLNKMPFEPKIFIRNWSVCQLHRHHRAKDIRTSRPGEPKHPPLNTNFSLWTATGQQTFCQDGRFVRKTFCQDRLRRFVRKTFCQDRLRRFVRTDLP